MLRPQVCGPGESKTDEIGSRCLCHLRRGPQEAASGIFLEALVTLLLKPVTSRTTLVEWLWQPPASTSGRRGGCGGGGWFLKNKELGSDERSPWGASAFLGGGCCLDPLGVAPGGESVLLARAQVPENTELSSNPDSDSHRPCDLQLVADTPEPQFPATKGTVNSPPAPLWGRRKDAKK